MTEAEWLACSDVAKMLEALRGKASARKARLFLAACSRGLYPSGVDKHCRRAVKVAEGYADEGVAPGKLTLAANDVRRSANVRWRERDDGSPAPIDLAVWLVRLTLADDIIGSIWHRTGFWPPEVSVALHDAGRPAPDLIRCIFGDPFRPAQINSHWQTADAISLARAAYDGRQLPTGILESPRLAVLADALEEAGASGDILTHLRSPGPHVRGCWPLDLVLGKS